MRKFKNESFISQFLSPKVIRDLKLFTMLDDEKKSELEIIAIHNKEGYQTIREMLAKQYDLSNLEPSVQVYNVNRSGDRSLTLRYYPMDERPLEPQSTLEILKHIYKLWGFPVRLEFVSEEGSITLIGACPISLDASEKKVNS